MIGLVRADQVLELSTAKLSSETFSVVIVSDQLHHYGLVVDRFLGEKNLVIRTLDNRLGKVQDISAAALLEDGTPVLILDVQDLVRSIDKILTTGYLSQAIYEPAADWSRLGKRILVIDDSITVRESYPKPDMSPFWLGFKTVRESFPSHRFSLQWLFVMSTSLIFCRF
jgi:two-component system sensor histidine kinase and response regulator WspE